MLSNTIIHITSQLDLAWGLQQKYSYRKLIRCTVRDSSWLLNRDFYIHFSFSFSYPCSRIPPFCVRMLHFHEKQISVRWFWTPGSWFQVVHSNHYTSRIYSLVVCESLHSLTATFLLANKICTVLYSSVNCIILEDSICNYSSSFLTNSY